MDDGTFIFTSSTELIDLYSMAPWGRISLDVEQLRIAQATESLKRHEESLRIVGAHVDGVFFLCCSMEAHQISFDLEHEHMFPDGSPMFHLKNEPTSKVPTWPATDPERSQSLEFRRHNWRVLGESDVADAAALANLVKEHGGLQLIGAAGTGKSRTVRKLVPELAKLFPGVKVLAMALRHCTAMLICGKTISHYLHKYRRKGGAPKAGTIVVIDEWSEVQLHTWVELARWKLVGVIFILVGDADGQRKPIFDKWQDSMNEHDIRQSQFIHELCGGLRLKLSVYRRGTDQLLFDRYTFIYRWADVQSELPTAISEMTSRYPYDPFQGKFGMFFVMSHKKRILLNHALNYIKAQNNGPLLFLPAARYQQGMTMEAQDMLIWKGLDLLCYSRRYSKNSPVTGAVYVVEDWDATTVTVRLHDDYIGESLLVTPTVAAIEDEMGEADDEAEESDVEALDDEEPAQRPPTDVRDGNKYRLSHKRASEVLRLQHALVYASIQGRTIKDTHIGLMDLDNPNFTMRDLITAMSRPTAGQYLHLLTVEEQAKVMADFRGAQKNSLSLLTLANHQPPSERPTPSRVGR